MKSGVRSIDASKKKNLIIEPIKEKLEIEAIGFDHEGTNTDGIIEPITH